MVLGEGVTKDPPPPRKKINTFMTKREISIQDAYHILRQCIGVMIEDRLVEPSIFDIEDDYSSEWLTLQWEEEYRGEHGAEQQRWARANVRAIKAFLKKYASTKVNG